MFQVDPNADVYLIKNVPFDPTYENTIYFSSVSEQINYFFESPIDRPVTRFTNISYVRKGRGWIRLEVPIGTAYQYGYMAFKNTDFENRTFYAFIDRVEYVNNVTTDIFFSIDVLQTWHFDYTFNQCMIEREHVADDGIGKNLIDENLAVGEYVWEDDTTKWIRFHPAIVIATTMSFNNLTPTPVGGYIFPGRIAGAEYFSGCQFIVYDAFMPAQVELCKQFLSDMAPYADSIVSVFMAAMAFIYAYTDASGQPIVPTPPTTQYLNESIKTTRVIDGESVTDYFLGNYAPRNKKLMCYPYNFNYVLSSSGDGHAFRYEFFTNPDSIQYIIWGNTSTDPGIILFADDYKGENCYDETVTLNMAPMCCWSYDTFKAWLVQNAGTLATSAVGGIVGALNGGGGSVSSTKQITDSTVNRTTPKGTRSTAHTQSITTTDSESFSSPMYGMSSLFSLAGKTLDMAFRPPTVMGNGNGDLLYSTFGMAYHTYHKHIVEEFAIKFDNYFDMYGYKTLRIGTPNRTVRPCYTYVKTVGCSVEGNMPAEDKRFIEKLFDKGVRWWKPNAVFGRFEHNVNNNLPGGGV